MASPPTPSAQQFQESFGPTNAGVNSGLPATLLAPNQLAFGVNVTSRNGYSHNRPVWRKLALTYKGDGVQLAATRGIFQCAAFYSSFGNNPSCLVSSIGGRIFRYVITGQRCVVDEVTPADGRNNGTLLQAWMAQGQDFLVINDGESRPIVFNGAGAYRLPPGTYLPPGKQLHYVNGRFIEVLPDGRSYIASDLVYSTVSGTPYYNYRDSILRTTENLSILAGASFAVPLNAGPISALFSVAIPDTSLGQGPLQVATLGGVFSVNLPLDATQWTTTQQPTQVVSLPNGGVCGQLAVTTVNGDAWYRSPSGLRSFVTARRDFNTWVQTDLSFEMERVLPFDTRNLLHHASTVDFNNRFLVTCSPYDTRGRGIAHRGLVALDFNNISSLTTRSQPCYDGLWTGQPVLQLVKGTFASIERCFAFCLDRDGFITLYEIGMDGAGWFDYDGDADVATQCWIESPSLLGKEGDRRGDTLKRILTGDLFFTELAGIGNGTIPINVQFVSDEYPCWRDWHDFELCAPSCAQPTACSQPVTTQPQYATFLRLPQPPDACNPVTKRPFRTGYEFQVKLAWEGHLELRKFTLWASPQPENLNNFTCAPPTCAVLQCCEDDLFSYQIEQPAGECDLVVVAQPSEGFPIEWSSDVGVPTWDVTEGSTIVVTPS